MSKSWLVLELWQFLFIKDWPEIQKLEISPSGFCQISADWGTLGTPNLMRMSLVKSYWLLQNARVTSYTVSKLLRKNQQVEKLPQPPPRLGLRWGFNSLRGWYSEINLSTWTFHTVVLSPWIKRKKVFHANI